MNSEFLKACRGETTSHTPIWLMRQAGRYMKEYRDVREKVSFLELCKTPELAAEVTVTAAKILKVDAAIIFADILLITEPLGFNLEFAKGEGPAIHNPFRSSKDLEHFPNHIDVNRLKFVGDAIRLTCKDLPKNTPLIGFAGAPFTVASYAIEGGSSRSFENTKTLMRSDPSLWAELMNRIADATILYLRSQIDAGATAIQLFDSWIGALNAKEFEQYVLPFSRKIFSSLPKDIPSIYFGTGTYAFLEQFAQAGSSVIGVDSQGSLGKCWRKIGAKAIQGNLDPTVLFSDTSIIKRETDFILKDIGKKPGHIFNLGHGILPTTPVDHAKFLIDYVHESTAK